MHHHLRYRRFFQPKTAQIIPLTDFTGYLCRLLEVKFGVDFRSVPLFNPLFLQENEGQWGKIIDGPQLMKRF